MLISEKRLETALVRLAESDETCAELKGAMLKAEYMAKCAESLAFTAAEGNVEERKAQARLSEPTKQAWHTYFEAVTKYEKIRASREREMVVVEIWRSLESSRRQGNVQ